MLRATERITIDFTGVEEDEKEEYLFEEEDCAIANFCMSSDSCNGMGKPDPQLWLNKSLTSSLLPSTKPNQKENPKKKLKNMQELQKLHHLHYYNQPHYIAFSLRDSSLLFAVQVQVLSKH